MIPSTVDEARAALLASLLDPYSTRERFEAAADALIAAVRAECAACSRGDKRAHAQHAATPAEEDRT